MKKLFVPLALGVSLVACASAHAAPAPPKLRHVLQLAFGSIVIPPEWDGIWTSVDSSSDCAGGPVQVSASEDTICGGEVFSPDDSGAPFEFTCTGSADATSIDITCTGGGEVVPDCSAAVTYHLVGTRTGDTFYSVGTYQTSFSGTAKGCDLIPDSCTRLATVATRTGPTPPGYCTTPARRSSWGSVKTLYR